MRTSLLVAARALGLSAGCVTEDEYDDAVRSAKDAQAQIRRMTAEDAAKVADLAASEVTLEPKIDERVAVPALQ